jgi:hypothetical protein
MKRELLNHSPVDEVLLNNPLQDLRGTPAVPHALRVYNGDRPLPTYTKTPHTGAID